MAPATGRVAKTHIIFLPGPASRHWVRLTSNVSHHQLKLGLPERQCAFNILEQVSARAR
jgi:hypothetical protein